MQRKLGSRIVDRTSLLVPKDLQARNLLKTSVTETLAHVLKGYLGAGLFAMGDAFKNSGYIFGAVGTLIIGLVCIYNNHLLVKMSREVKRRKKLPLPPTFPETITSSFELGPSGFKKMTPAVMVIMKSFICVTQLGFCVIYISLVGETLKNILVGIYEINVRLCILVTFPVLFAASLIHTLKFLAPVSAISTLFLIYGYGASIAESSEDIPDLSERDMVAPPIKWPLFLGTVIFSFEGIALIIPLRNEMKQPEKFDKPLGPLNIGMVIFMSLLISLGSMSYLKWGEDVRDSVTFNLSDTWVGNSAQILFALGVLFTYPLQFYVAAKLLFKDMKRNYGPFKRPLMMELLLRTVLVISTYVIAVAIPYINLLLSLIGAVCSNALALLFPALADICLRCTYEEEKEDEDEDKNIIKEDIALKKNVFRFIMDAISLVLSIIGTVLGGYLAIEAIVNKFVAEITNNDSPKDEK